MTEDRLDPEVRALAEVRYLRSRELVRASLVVAVSVFAAAAGIAVAAEELGEGGAIGASTAALVVLIVAWGAWPVAWSPSEQRHRELEAMWQQARPDALDEVPWDRSAAWARAQDDAVVLLELRRAGSTAEVVSPYSLHERRRVDGMDPTVGAEAMQGLRAELAEREDRERRAYETSVMRAEEAAHEAALRDIDEEAAAVVAIQEAALREEFAAEEAAERRRDAEALARSLRKP